QFARRSRMRRSMIVLMSTVSVAACGGHSSAPGTAPQPAARAAAPAGDPATVRYAPGSGRYRMEQSQHLVQEMMGQTEEVNATLNVLASTSFTAGTAGNL